MVVDTLASTREMRGTLDAVRRLGEVIAVVNTHDHVDHVLGNSLFDGLPIHAHEETAAALERLRDDRPGHDGDRAEEVDASPVVVPTDTFSSAR